MSPKIKDGGPAFPQFDYGNRGAGMNLRDYFAGQVIVGATTHVDGWDSLADMAASAYQLADAMLKAREADPS